MGKTSQRKRQRVAAFSRSEWPNKAKDWLPVFVVGSFVGMDLCLFSIAMATLMFSGPLVGGINIAVTASILSTCICIIMITFFSQLGFSIGSVQDVGVAVLAQVLSTTVATLAQPEDVRLATAIIIVALASFLSALLLLFTGYMGWGRIVRFFPQSVLAGFLAGTGWVLVSGGISVATGIGINDLFRTTHWTAQAVENTAPALVFGVALFFVTRHVQWKGILVSLMIAAIIGFHVWLWGSGTSVAAAQAAGWLSAPRDDQSVVSGFAFANIIHLSVLADFPTIIRVLPVIATIAFLTMIGTLLNTSALSVIGNRDADANAELRLTGALNLALSAIAAPPAHVDISGSVMVLRSGIRRRGVGPIAALIALFGLFNVATITEILPIFVTSGLIIYFGINFLFDWLIRTQKTYGREEWSVVGIILAIVIVLGFAQAILAGLLIACLIFAFNYASIPVLRRTSSLQNRSSTLARAPAEAAWLREHGNTVEVIELQGYMFFGTADRLYDHLRRRISETTVLHSLIVDFRHIVGLDAAAAAQLGRVATLAKRHPFDLVFSGYSDAVLATLSRAAPELMQDGTTIWSPSLDAALERAEDAVLALAPTSAIPTNSLLQRLAPDATDFPRLERFFASLTSENYSKGTVIMHAGSPADSLVFLESGRVVVTAPSTDSRHQRLRSMSSGAILGDIGLALNTHRTADVVAETDVILRRLSQGQLQKIEIEDPALCLALYRLLRRSLAEKIVFDERFENSGR